MSALVFAAGIIASFETLGTDAATKNWGDAVATGVEDVYGVAQIALMMGGGGEATRAFMEAADPWILECALLAVEVIGLLNGFGQEDTGDVFKTAVANLKTAEALLEAAYPSSDWVGKGEENYAEADTDQLARVKTLADLDRQMQGLIEKEAAEVDDARNMIGYIKTGIFVAMPIAMSLYYAGLAISLETWGLVPPTILSIPFQYAVATASIGSTTYCEAVIGAAAEDNARTMRKLTSEYEQLANSAQDALVEISQPSSTSGGSSVSNTSESLGASRGSTVGGSHVSGSPGAVGGGTSGTISNVANGDRTPEGRTLAGTTSSLTTNVPAESAAAAMTRQAPLTRNAGPVEQVTGTSRQVGYIGREVRGSAETSNKVGAEQTSPTDKTPTADTPADNGESAGVGPAATGRAPLGPAKGEHEAVAGQTVST
jgi:hypothetical protein